MWCWYRLFYTTLAGSISIARQLEKIDLGRILMQVSGLLAYNFANSPFSAAKAPLARARRIQGDAEEFGVAIVNCVYVCTRECGQLVMNRVWFAYTGSEMYMYIPELRVRGER